VSRRAGGWALVGLAVFTAVVVSADRAFERRAGLHARYADASEPPPAGGSLFVDRSPSTSVLTSRRPDCASRPFAVEWRGFLTVATGGTYTFAIVSNGRATAYVRGREVATRRPEAPFETRTSLSLDPGIHSIFIQLAHLGPGCGFELLWSRDGGPYETLPEAGFVPDRISDLELLARRGAPLLTRALGVAWYLVVAVALLIVARRLLIPLVTFDRGEGTPIAWVLLIAMALNIWGVWWGMPNTRGWAPDELVPPDVMQAWQARFSNGWYQKYPPVHYAVLAAADSPLLMLSWLRVVDLDAPNSRFALAMIGRAVSLAFAAGVLLVIYRCGLLLYGRRGAALAALTMAVTLPFAYHAKLANVDVPYLFWFACSLLAYLRILRGHAPRDYFVFAVTAALAGCTKDQAWSLYPMTIVAMLVARARSRSDSVGSPVSPLLDRTVMTAALLGLVTTLAADNVVFNPEGFASHLRFLLTVPGGYQRYPRTVGGELQMAWDALRELRYMFGIPLSAVVAVSMSRALARSDTTPSLRWVLVPGLSYYLSFLGIALFFYDRFLLPIVLVLSLCTGAWLERVLADRVAARRARLAVIAAVYAYSVIYTAAADYAMSFDSRYAVTRWLKGRALADDVIGALGPLEYAAMAGSFREASVSSLQEVQAIQPTFIVLKAADMPLLPDYVQAMHNALVSGAAGYRLAATFRTTLPGPPLLHPDLGPAPRHIPDLSDLSMINPTIEVFERIARAAP
jgi:hypothetical protein